MCFCLARVIVIGTRDYLKTLENFSEIQRVQHKKLKACNR